MAGSLDKGASAEKRAKTHHDPIFLDTTAAAHLLAGIRQHLQKAVSLSRAEEEQRKLTNELLRKTRLEAAADAERSNENIGRAISISSAAHAELQKILPSWLLRESSESEAEEEEEDSRFKEMEAEIRELKQFVPCSLQLLAERAIVLRFTKKSLLAVWHTRPNSKARS